MNEIELTGRIVTPGDDEYEQARTNNNLSNPKFPRIIVFCQNTKDIENALQWVRDKQIPFRVRSGRHSYENFSLVNGGLIIDISEMNKITVNREKMTAIIEGGANLGHVYRTLWKHGTTIPAGTESSVGLAGLALGGGIGMLTRWFGLTCDNLLEIEMVLAKGTRGAERIIANKNQNSDLFWACRGGGGGNFGIVTSFTFKVHPVSKVSIFSITWGWENFEKVFNGWQTWAVDTDHRLTSEIELKTKESNQLTVQGEYVGSAAKLKHLLQPLLDSGSPTDVFIKEVPYIEAVKFFDEPSGNVPAYRKRSGSFLERKFPEKAILIMKNFLANAPNKNATIWHQSLGGKAAMPESFDSAFYYRNAIIAQEYNSTWNSPQEENQNIRWVEALRNALSPYTIGDYVNWPDRNIRNWPMSYYGDNFNILRKVKTSYDPYNVFQFPQSIPPYKKWL
ncbi:FAD-dependent oxidoreductase [Bacillus sp. Marseille-P3661]|uniref:FAD-dependent oxidoreductase n=1 Tax=Bacillus sp. Marseille-P3661 TaxID=1936234 RepID=UPI000C8561EC|nr:FAD-binding oxidoreductase [Bacillus sp. Marseille-P3661]